MMAAPGFHGRFRNRLPLKAAHVVHQHVEPAELFGDGLNQFFDLRGIGNVGGQSQTFCPHRPQIRQNLLSAQLIGAKGHRHAQAGTPQRQGNFLADSARGSSYQGNAIAESHASTPCCKL